MSGRVARVALGGKGGTFPYLRHSFRAGVLSKEDLHLLHPRHLLHLAGGVQTPTWPDLPDTPETSAEGLS